MIYILFVLFTLLLVRINIQNYERICMLVNIGNATSITTMFDGKLTTLPDSEDWSIWLKNTRNLTDSSIRVFMKAMERFWVWALHNPIGTRETFPAYQARYRNDLRRGYEISKESYSEEFEDSVKITISKCDPLEKSTINKEIAGINSYFYFVEESELIEDHRFVNYLYEKHRSEKSFLSGIQIKKSNLAIEAFGKKITYLPPYKISKNRQRVKYFPLELFDELLDMAKPRERLIYLLCGACSARIGQALNLTLYDIDYEKEEVWLIDPKSDYDDIYGNKRREWLKNEYEIDMFEENPHNTPDLQFKYPIPFFHEPIYWLAEDKYRKLFFDTLTEYTKSQQYQSEYARYPRHPFLFVTKTGKRVHARETLSRFKALLRKLSIRHPDYKWINDLGLHSLRHMFGHTMAEIYARTGDDTLPKMTMEMMGHSNFESTLVYFTTSRKTVRAVLKKHADKIFKTRTD